MPSKCKALSSNPIPPGGGGEERGRKGDGEEEEEERKEIPLPAFCGSFVLSFYKFLSILKGEGEGEEEGEKRGNPQKKKKTREEKLEHNYWNISINSCTL
jgi:hypothetical protein